MGKGGKGKAGKKGDGSAGGKAAGGKGGKGKDGKGKKGGKDAGGKGKGKNGNKGKGKGKGKGKDNNRAVRYGPYEHNRITKLEAEMKEQREMMDNMTNPFTLNVISPAIRAQSDHLKWLKKNRWRECQRTLMAIIIDFLEAWKENTAHISDKSWKKEQCHAKIMKLITAAKFIVPHQDIPWIKIDRTAFYCRFQQNSRGRCFTDLVLTDNAVQYFNTSLKFRLLGYEGKAFTKFCELKEKPDGSAAPPPEREEEFQNIPTVSDPNAVDEQFKLLQAAAENAGLAEGGMNSTENGGVNSAEGGMNNAENGEKEYQIGDSANGQEALDDYEDDEDMTGGGTRIVEERRTE
jgi:hypothetical protein